MRALVSLIFVTALTAGNTVAAARDTACRRSAVEIARAFGFPITNSMVVTWIVAVGADRVRTAGDAADEAGARRRAELSRVAGREPLQLPRRHPRPASGDQTFWFFGTMFIFILAANWVGLIPGVGSIGWGHTTAEGFGLEQPLFRGANADVNLTLAMALVFFACWIVWGLQAIGPVGFFKELFAPKGETTGALKLLMVVVFFAAGLLEVISILFRPVSLSFRLYGNVFAGETMLETMAQVPYIGWLVQIPFYFLELLVGLVQALVFMLLTAVFTLLICQHHEEDPRALHGCTSSIRLGQTRRTVKEGTETM